MPSGEEIYATIEPYRGGQLVPKFDPVERAVFRHIADWFGGWMRTNGIADRSTETAASVRGILHTFEAPGMLAKNAESFRSGAKLGSDKITGPRRLLHHRDLEEIPWGGALDRQRHQ